MVGLGVKIFILCFVAAISSGAFAAKVPTIHKSSRVMGGKSVNISERPYLVQLRDTDFGLFICGGTLVDPTHVITAAHCLKGSNPVSDFKVVGGASTIFEDGVERKIVAYFLHPSYGKGHEFANDAAVLKLDAPLVGKDITPIDVSYDGVGDEQFLTISGWGTTEKGMTGAEKMIRTARVAKIPADECEQKYKDYKGVTSSMMCAATPGKDACQGDSGGPGVYRGKLCAIVSWGKGCAHPDYPGIYTGTNTVKEFLVKALQE